MLRLLDFGRFRYQNYLVQFRHQNYLVRFRHQNYMVRFKHRNYLVLFDLLLLQADMSTCQQNIQKQDIFQVCMYLCNLFLSK